MTTARKPRKIPWANLEIRTSNTGIYVVVPIQVVSEANRRCHWSKALLRKKEQRSGLVLALGRRSYFEWPGSAMVTLTRLHPANHLPMDGDNLQRAFKGVRDFIAVWMGRDDGDPDIAWKYAQTIGEVVGVSVRIELHRKTRAQGGRKPRTKAAHFDFIDETETSQDSFTILSIEPDEE